MIETADDRVARERLSAALEADSSGEALQFDEELQRQHSKRAAEREGLLEAFQFDEELQRQVVKSRPMQPAEYQARVPVNRVRTWIWRAYLLLVVAAAVWVLW